MMQVYFLLLGGRDGERGATREGGGGRGNSAPSPFDRELSDDVPFITSDGAF
jgi:hypothetical protein